MGTDSGIVGKPRDTAFRGFTPCLFAEIPGKEDIMERCPFCNVYNAVEFVSKHGTNRACGVGRKRERVPEECEKHEKDTRKLDAWI